MNLVRIAIIVMLISVALISGCLSNIGIETKELKILDKTTYTAPSLLTSYTAFYVTTDKGTYQINAGRNQLDDYRVWEGLEINETYYCDISYDEKYIVGTRAEMPPPPFTKVKYSSGKVV